MAGSRGWGPRLLAVGAAVGWGVFFFGVIDLAVVIIQDTRFDEAYLLETGWGLLYTVLVTAPLVAFAVRPRSPVALQQLIVVAAAVLVCALITPAAGQIVPAILLTVTCVALSTWTGHRLLPARGLSLRGIDRGTATLAASAVLAAVIYAARMIHSARSGQFDEETWRLMHLPMQAAFGLSVAGAAVLAVLARAAGSPGWQLPAFCAAASAVWFGAVSMAYPAHVGGLGRVPAAVAVAWGVAFALLAARSRRAERRPRRTARIRRAPAVGKPYENPYRHGVCAAEWTKD